MQDPRKKIEMALQQKMMEIAESRKECMEILRPSRAAPTLAQRIGRVGRADSQALFETAIRCFGEGSWDRLLQQGISENAIKDLSDHVRSFLKASIQAKQLENAGEISHDLTSVPPPSFEEAEKILGKISSLLNAEWQYDVDHDIHAPTILLIEYELGFICRKSQLDVVSENLTKNNRFKQEICGGGKTTVLRNIISQARADGKTMSGVSTLDPLRSEHGLLYARTTKNAFGEEVFDFHFNRASPSDENSLLDLHKQFLEITVNRGRVDLCRGDLQSFKLAMHLKNESIAEKRREYAERIQENPLDAKAPGILEDITRIHRELDVMEDIRDFLIEHASIMADELDKDCDPTQEKNDAYGESSSLDSAKRTAACTLLRTLFESSDRRLTVIRKALLQNEQARLSREDPQQIVDGLKALAENVWDESYRAFGFASKEEFASYLTDPEHSERIFESVFKKYSIPPLNASPLPHQLENIAFLRKYLSDIVPNAMKKTGGVSYGRSQKDKTLVIPYRDSDAPKEGSLHGNDMERIWYTSVDYVQAGISAEQARAEWIEANDKALKELLAANRAKIEMTKDQTVSATQFKKKYGIAGSFSSLTEKDVDAMRTALKERPIQMVAFLEENVLPSLRQNTEKIVSDAQDPPSMVKSYSGSSGTDTGAMALPDKIDIINARQEGVHGKTWERMLESDTRLAGQSFMPTLDQKNQYGSLAEMMNGGDCLSDVGRLFPGIPSKQIAKELSSKISPNKNIEYIVFMDPNDCWKMLRTSDGKEVDYIPTKNREQLLRRITLFDPAHTRGAERDSTSGVTEYVTIDVDTDLSRFEQAVARERNVLAGTANVKYILTPGLVTKMTNMGGCTIGNLLAVVSENEANQLKTLNYKAECQKIKHILKDAGETALRALSRKCRAFDASQHHELRERTHSALRHLFFASSTMDAHEAAHPSGEQSTESALDGLVLHQLKIARDIQDEMRAKELTSYSAPLVFKDVKDSLQQINEGITSVLRAQHEFSSVIATFKTSAEASQWPFMAKVKEAAIKADAQVNSPEINEKIAVVRKKQAELQRLLQSEKTFEGLSEELRLDLSSQIRKTAAQAREELESILREITTQQMRVDSAITEISPEKNAPKPTDLLGHLTAAVKKAAVKVVERYANWRTEGGVDKIQGALKSLSDEIRKLLETTKTLESKTSPLVSLAQEALSEAVPLLLAKLSPKQQQIELEKFPEADREKIKAAIRTAKGRVPLEFLPKMVRGSTADQDKEAEVETEQEQEVEEEQELETEEGKTLLGKEYQHQRLSWPSDINAETEPLSAHSAIRLENKRFTQNCYPIKKSDGKIAPWTIGVDGKSVLPEEHKLIERSIFIVKDQQLTEVYGSQLDLRDVANQNPENVCIYNYVLGKVDFGENPPPDLHEQFMQHIVTTKLFRGDVEFSETEQPFLRSYVMSLSPAEKKSLKEALPQVIAKYRPDMTYTGSSLKKLLENKGL